MSRGSPTALATFALFVCVCPSLLLPLRRTDRLPPPSLQGYSSIRTPRGSPRGTFGTGPQRATFVEADGEPRTRYTAPPHSVAASRSARSVLLGSPASRARCSPDRPTDRPTGRPTDRLSQAVDRRALQGPSRGSTRRGSGATSTRSTSSTPSPRASASARGTVRAALLPTDHHHHHHRRCCYCRRRRCRPPARTHLSWPLTRRAPRSDSDRRPRLLQPAAPQ